MSIGVPRLLCRVLAPPLVFRGADPKVHDLDSEFGATEHQRRIRIVERAVSYATFGMITPATAAPSPVQSSARCLRFSLRTLLAIVTALGLLLGVLVHRANRQRRAVEAIRALGGTVRYDYEVGGLAEAPLPDWLCRTVGLDFFCDVTRVDFFDPTGLTRDEDLLRQFKPISDSDLAHVAAFSELEELYCGSLYRSRYSYGGIDSLTGQPLEPDEAEAFVALRGQFFNVSDDGLAHLTALTNLRHLWLDDTRITDAGLRHLHGLIRLETVCLFNSNITPAGAAELQAALPDCDIEC
jgi:hypothetical protein